MRASPAGLAPMGRDSGQRRGKRFIRGGRAHLRQALYMPALVAVRCNAGMKASYHALLIAVKPPKTALTAIMRTLLILAKARTRDWPDLDPKTRLAKTDAPAAPAARAPASPAAPAAPRLRRR